MRSKRKNAREANGPVVVVISTPVAHTGQFQRETMMEVGLRLQARRQLLQQMAPQYRGAPSAHKRKLLDAFTQITGYHRKYAMWLLNHTEEGQPPAQQAHPRHYRAEVQETLVQVWDAANRICAKRLIPFLPTFVEALERHGHLHLDEVCRQRSGQAGIGKDLGKLWEEHHNPGLDLVLITSHLLAQLRLQTDHFSRGGNLLIGKGTRPLLSAE